MSNTSTTTHAIVQLGDRGRLVIPADLRHQLGLEAGDRLLVRATASGGLSLEPWDAILDRMMGIFANTAPERLLSDELIADRRAEVARDEDE